jgi:hypothetical protein
MNSETCELMTNGDEREVHLDHELLSSVVETHICCARGHQLSCAYLANMRPARKVKNTRIFGLRGHTTSSQMGVCARNATCISFTRCDCLLFSAFSPWTIHHKRGGSTMKGVIGVLLKGDRHTRPVDCLDLSLVFFLYVSHVAGKGIAHTEGGGNDGASTNVKVVTR